MMDGFVFHNFCNYILGKFSEVIKSYLYKITYNFMHDSINRVKNISEK